MIVHNLPYYSTPFVGRSREIAQISTRISDPNCRLLSLVGPGGMGKTRLAIQVAEQYAGQFPDSIYFVPFQSLGSPDYMVSTIADVIGFHFNPGSDPRQQLLHYLQHLELLLVLDNLEHLLEGVNLLAEILHAAPGVRILATSRERLNLIEEWVFDVRELDYPATNTAKDLETYSAVKLFLHHVRRMNADATLDASQHSAVIRICQLVGGMPLGIELAAAWARTLSYEGIAQGIESSLDILETSARNIEVRHRNIRVTFDRMWDRLSDVQRSVFKQLSIFRGSFTLRAADHITGASIHIISSLVDRSIVRMDDRGRYDLHELLRQYAEERLHESTAELYAVGKRHCQYFTSYLHDRKHDLEGKRQQAALEEIHVEIDNIRAAWLWAVEHKQGSEIGQACHALWFFYDTRSWYEEMARSFGTAASAFGMDQSDTPENHILGRLMAYYGTQDALERSLSMLRHLDSRFDIGFVLLRLSEGALFHKGDPETAQTYLRESLSIFRDLGNHWGTAYSLRWLGHASIYMDDYEEAYHLGEASLAIYDESGDSWGRALALGVIGICALEFGQYERAKAVSQESLTLCEAIGLRWHPPLALITYGAAACGLGDSAEARRYLYQGLKDAYEIPVVPTVLFGLLEIVPWLIAQGDKVKALEILSFLLAYPAPPVRGKRPVSRLISQLQKELPDNVSTSTIELGRSLTLNAVVETCLAILQRGSDFPHMGQLLTDRLTEREIDVLRLAASGLTNPQIAAKLVLTVGTVKWYLHQIYTKLNVGTRTQAAARARELNLLP